MSKYGIVNVKMVITEEKILSNIDKVQKMINPNNKKQIVQLEEDGYFRDLIESIKTYLTEYPRNQEFPADVYKNAYSLVEYATNSFEENTKQIEELIRQREKNINLAAQLHNVFNSVDEKEKDWKTKVQALGDVFGEDIVETLEVIGKSRAKTTDTYQDAAKIITSRIANLESNLHIEIDIERIEDRSKALSFIGIEVAESLKGVAEPKAIAEEAAAQAAYEESMKFETKPSLWQRIKESKIGKAVRTVFRIRIRLDVPALPEGRGE